MSLVENALKKLQKGRAGAPDSRRPEVPAARSPDAGTGRSEGGAAAPKRAHRPTIFNRDLLRSEHLLPAAGEERQANEEYRHIKRQLLANATGRGTEPVADGFRIMVTSALPGEGKTFTSLNLALSLAQEPDYSVLLVDADIAKAHLSQLFAVEKQAGLLDAIADESVDVEEFVFDTDVSGLSFLGAGTLRDSSGELLASARMARLLDHLAANDDRRVILLDSSPLLLTNESRALAPLVGQVVVVVHAGVTPQRLVHEALSHLDHDKAVGMVLNQGDVESRGGYYYNYGRTAQAESR